MTTRKIRICHIITGLGSGGAEAMLMKLVTSLNPVHFENIVISLTDYGKYGELLRRQGIAVHTIDMKNKKRLLAAPFAFRRLINELKPDILQGWMGHGNLASLFSCLPFVHKAPIVWNIRQSLNNFSHIPRGTRWTIELNARLSGLPNSIIYNSGIGATEHEAIGYDQTKTIVIPNGFDTDLFVPNPTARTEFLENHNLPESSLLLGLVARWDPLKDHPNFIRASRALASRHKNLYFLLAGQGMGPENVDLVSLVTEQGIAERTLLLGEVSNIPRLMATLDIFVLCSLAEGFPNVVGEAMACAVPPVTSDVGECRKIVGDSGRVIPAANTEALIAAVEELILRGADYRSRLGANARARILEHYSLPAIASQYEALYRGNLCDR